jgi:hypothetical protein
VKAKMDHCKPATTRSRRRASDAGGSFEGLLDGCAAARTVPLDYIFEPSATRATAFFTSNTGTQMRHTIRLTTTSPGRYSAEHKGRIIVTDSASVIADAARAILASGANDHDTIHVVSRDVSIADMPLHRLAAPRPRTLRSTADYQHALARQEPISAPLWR